MWKVHFKDRTDAGSRLAERLQHLRGENVVVLGLPRGGVPVAYEVARSLDAPLDVILVRKLGVPTQPELGMGAIGEGGVRLINPSVVAMVGVTDEEIAEVERAERLELENRAQRFRRYGARVTLEGRIAVIVDDGVATGATAAVACKIARELGARRVILAVPVAPPGWDERAGEVADEYVCVETPDGFHAIGEWYEDFSQTSDDEVIDCLSRFAQQPASATSAGGQGHATVEQDVEILLGTVVLGGYLTIPEKPSGVIVFAHGSGSSRHSPRNQFVATVLEEGGYATFLFDLLTIDEARSRAKVFDVELLADRLIGATQWLRSRPDMGSLPIGYFGASTGAAAALWAAADMGRAVAAVVSRGGRPDLAGPRLAEVASPTRLIVGGRDDVVLELNRKAQAMLRCENDLVVVEGATHLFEEPGTLRQAAGFARDWFARYVSGRATGAAKAGRAHREPFDPHLARSREEAEGLEFFSDPFSGAAFHVQSEQAQGTEIFVNPDEAVPGAALKEGSPGHESYVAEQAGIESDGDDDDEGARFG